MTIWSKSPHASLVAALLTLSYAPNANSAQGDTVRSDAGLCRRAPAPIELAAEPPETYLQRESRAAPDASASPPLPAPPPPDGSPARDREVVVTGSIIAGSAAVGVPVTTLGEESFAEGSARDGSAFEYRERPAQAPPSGLLTAGDYDDLLNPILYARYVDKFLENEPLQGVPRVDTGRVLAVDIRDRSGHPVPFAPVTLTCADGNQLTLATTADGSAIFFPELDRLGESVLISVPDRASQSAYVVSLAGRGDMNRQTITVEGAARAVERFDLALVVDTTGSMADELEYLKSELGAILADLNRDHRNLDIRVAFVAYRDVGDAYVTRTFPFTSDIAALRDDLSQQSAGGGGDYPEAVEQALARAIALDWRPNAVRSILFVADAPPHAEDVAASWRSAEVARAGRIQIVPVGASGVGDGAEYMMRAMAALTQSRYIFLTDDSGIGNPHAEPSVDCYLVTKLNASIRRVLDSQISGRRIEPGEDEIIRSVGDYDAGRCILEPQRR